jgi:uracil-DNA glycosylase
VLLNPLLKPVLPELEPSWQQMLDAEFHKPYFAKLQDFLRREHEAGYTIYPPVNDIFNAFAYMPFEGVRVVILGQDPYHGEGQAHGLAFSVKKGVGLPPSLKNIYKELSQDLHIAPPKDGDLTPWARQGVLLLNTCLTVRAGQAHSHSKQGWEIFTDAVITLLSRLAPHPLVFVLWGAPAQRKAALIDNQRHLILTAPHPSPLSAHRGFLGCRHFSTINDFLTKHGKKPIQWEK